MIKGVTSHQAPETQQDSAKSAAMDDCLAGVFRTARLEPATGRLQQTQPATVKINQPKQNFLKNIHYPADNDLCFPKLQASRHLPDFVQHFRHFRTAHFTSWNHQHPDGGKFLVNLAEDFPEQAPSPVAPYRQAVISP